MTKISSWLLLRLIKISNKDYEEISSINAATVSMDTKSILVTAL